MLRQLVFWFLVGIAIGTIMRYLWIKMQAVAAINLLESELQNEANR